MSDDIYIDVSDDSIVKIGRIDLSNNTTYIYVDKLPPVCDEQPTPTPS